MKNLFRREISPEPTVAWRAEQIADLDAEERRNEQLLYDAAKNIGGVAIGQEVLPVSEDPSS